MNQHIAQPDTAPSGDRAKVFIAAADTVVFVVSPDAASSSICWELEESLRCGKRVISLVAREIDDATAPVALGRVLRVAEHAGALGDRMLHRRA